MRLLESPGRILILAVLACTAAAAEDEPAHSRPFLPVIGQLNISATGKAGKTLSESELQALADNYAGIEVAQWLRPSREQIERLKARNHDFIVLPYLNSSNAQPNLTQALEKDRYNTISLYWEASLDADVGDTDRTLRLVPADSGRGVRLKASTSADEQSRSAVAFVTFIRVDDELMRVESVEPSSGSVNVTRAFASTKAVAHRAGARVFAPVYVGSKGQWSGVPGVGEKGLRYAMRIETEQVAQLLGDQVVHYMNDGADGAWLDICSPSFFNLGNAYGDAVVPWNFAKNTEFTEQTRKEAQDVKLGRLLNYVHGQTDRWPLLVANNNGNGDYFETGGGAMDFVQQTANKPRAIRAVVLEGAFSYEATNRYAKVDAWKANLSTIIHGAKNGLPVWPWLKSFPARLRPAAREDDAFALYDYASVLLGWEFGESGAAIVTEAMAEDGKGGRTVYLPPFWFYDLGKPTERAPYDDIDKLRAPDHVSYVRRWSGGIVLVNPTAGPDKAIKLDSGYLDPITKEAVSEVKLGPHAARILVRGTES